ncbi:unnamed protein product, partial [Thlaspi arvense]
INCQDIVLEDVDITKALVEYVNQEVIETLVLGAPSKSGLFKYSRNCGEKNTRFLYSKISSARSASRPAPGSFQIQNNTLSDTSQISFTSYNSESLSTSHFGSTSSHSFDSQSSSYNEMDF